MYVSVETFLGGILERQFLPEGYEPKDPFTGRH